VRCGVRRPPDLAEGGGEIGVSFVAVGLRGDGALEIGHGVGGPPHAEQRQPGVRLIAEAVGS
jgi:hypothetical protein